MAKRFLKNASLLDRKNSDGIFLLTIAALLPVFLFLPLSSRLIYYSIPAIPPYIMLCAGWWGKHRRHSSKIEPQSASITYPTSSSTSLSTGILCISPVRIVSQAIPVKTVDLYGVIAFIIGLSFYALIVTVSPIVSLLPEVLQTAEISRLIIIIAFVLGTGWLTSGIAMQKQSSLAWLPLVTVLAITYLVSIRGFYLYQNIRSSKAIVSQADLCLSAETLWTYEGSREIGAAGAIGYYLNQVQPIDYRQNNSGYRTVMVLADGGKNRIPPQFPGATPKYLLDRSQLQSYWDSDRPVVFLTDFLRQPYNSKDPLSLNLPQGAAQPYMVKGQRHLYLNSAAASLARDRCSR